MCAALFGFGKTRSLFAVIDPPSPPIMRAMISSSAFGRKQSDSSLSIQHHHHVPDCESTVFSVIPNTRKIPKRCSSRGRRYVHDQSSFSSESSPAGNIPAFYIGLHKRRFHIVMSTDDMAAAHAIREAIRAEESSRQTLDLIFRDTIALNTLTVMERNEYEPQYAALGAILTSRAQTFAGTFSSVCWTGAKSSLDLQSSQSADPCLLCKMSLQHTVRVLRLGAETGAEDSSTSEASFASQPVHMFVEVLNDRTRIFA